MLKEKRQYLNIAYPINAASYRHKHKFLCEMMTSLGLARERHSICAWLFIDDNSMNALNAIKAPEHENLRLFYFKSAKEENLVNQFLKSTFYFNTLMRLFENNIMKKNGGKFDAVLVSDRNLAKFFLFSKHIFKMPIFYEIYSSFALTAKELELFRKADGIIVRYQKDRDMLIKQLGQSVNIKEIPASYVDSSIVNDILWNERARRIVDFINLTVKVNNSK